MNNRKLSSHGLPEGWEIHEESEQGYLRRNLFHPSGSCVLSYLENPDADSPEDVDASAKWTVHNDVFSASLNVDLQLVIETYQTVLDSLRTGGMMHPLKLTLHNKATLSVYTTFDVSGYYIQLWVHSPDTRTLVASGYFPRNREDGKAITEVMDRLYLVTRLDPEYEAIPLHLAKRWLSHAQPIKKNYVIQTPVTAENEEEAWDFFDSYATNILLEHKTFRNHCLLLEVLPDDDN